MNRDELRIIQLEGDLARCCDERERERQALYAGMSAAGNENTRLKRQLEAVREAADPSYGPWSTFVSGSASDHD